MSNYARPNCEESAAGIGGAINLLAGNGNAKYFESLPQYNYLELKGKNDKVAEMLEPRIAVREVTPGEQQVFCTIMKKVGDGELQRLRSKNNRTATDPRKFRSAITMKGPVESKGPKDYDRDQTEEGKVFSSIWKNMLNTCKIAKQYLLFWVWPEDTTTTTTTTTTSPATDTASTTSPDTTITTSPDATSTTTLPDTVTTTSPDTTSTTTTTSPVTATAGETATNIGDHPDQSEGDIHDDGSPNEHTNRTVVSSGRETTLVFTLKMVCLKEIEDGKWGQQTETLGKHSIDLPGPSRAYCMTPVAAGRHAVGRVKYDGKDWLLVFLHRSERKVGPGDFSSRVIMNTDKTFTTEKDSNADFDAFKRGEATFSFDQSPDLSGIDLVDFGDTPQSVANKIDSCVRNATPPHEWNDKHRCRSCPNPADFYIANDDADKENQPPLETSISGVELRPGCVVCVVDTSSNDDSQVGVITNIENHDSITVTFVRGTSRVATDYHPNQIWPAKDTDAEAILGKREDCDTDSYANYITCRPCAEADPNVMDSGKVVENPCPKCFQSETLRGLSYCSTCGEYHCSGYLNNEGDREYECVDSGLDDGHGTRLTVDNAGQDRRAICVACYNAKHTLLRRRDGATVSTAHYPTAEMYREAYEAFENGPCRITHGARAKTPGRFNLNGSVKEILGQGESNGIESWKAMYPEEKKKDVNTVGKFFSSMKKKKIPRCDDCADCVNDNCIYKGRGVEDLAHYEAFLNHRGTFGKESQKPGKRKRGSC